ncbi:NUDIX domain-containing protein [Devosia rhizoryzae]|uniref:NUDIX domain-containing protein n=1 Tax=Devosia rhizoryzae TaxID=2774137 RepID=A0ABX7C1K1_9HYPH|nr:NUDIX domain-containing protein [Devosia rhizoryzae]QQR38105.1 NUDIX domain-containing protein [Devosia rhizoryzae]
MTDLPNAASVGLVREGKILLIKRAFAPYQNLWTFPGGRLEPGETIEQCATRELQEELAITIRNPKLVMQQALGRDGEYRLAVFVSTDFSGVMRPSEEISAHMWADPGMVHALRTTSRLDDVIRECFKVLGQSW